MNEIHISSITHIGTRGMFLGAATGIQVTYVKSNGQKKTLGYSTKDYLDPKRLHDILDVLVVINPKLNIPRELRNLA